MEVILLRHAGSSLRCKNAMQDRSEFRIGRGQDEVCAALGPRAAFCRSVGEGWSHNSNGRRCYKGTMSRRACTQRLRMWCGVSLRLICPYQRMWQACDIGMVGMNSVRSSSMYSKITLVVQRCRCRRESCRVLISALEGHARANHNLVLRA
jgi:hypothetical protein